VKPRSVLPLLVGSLLAAVPARGQPAEGVEDSIRRVSRELDSTRSRLAADSAAAAELARRETTMLGRLEASARLVAASEQELRRIAGQLAARAADISRTTRELDSLSAAVAARRAELSRRLVAVYKHSRLFPLQVVFSSRTISDLYRRALFLRLIGRTDQRVVAELNAVNLELDRRRARLLAGRAELLRLHESAARQYRELEAARAAEAALLAQIRGQRRLREAMRDELNVAAGRLAALLVQLKSRPVPGRPDTSALAAARGQLPWPVTGTVQTGFGAQVHPKYRTTTNNPGIDIAVPAETDVRAVAAGRVSYADRFLGYGNLVIIDHGAGFYTLYGNLYSVAVQVGARVSEGGTIGTVRDHLHFEVRREGQPVNPLDWLSRDGR